jgi:hypothetical protein
LQTHDETQRAANVEALHDSGDAEFADASGTSCSLTATKTTGTSGNNASGSSPASV